MKKKSTNKIIKCLILKIDTTIITEIDEVPSELGEPDCKLINPFTLAKGIAGDYYLNPWPDVTEQREMMIHSDSILTIVDPKPDLIDKYLELTK
jgi:hypothetical protein